MTEEIQNNKDLKNSDNGFWVLVWDRLLDSIDVIVGKLTSGSFIATVGLVATYCWIGKHLISAIPPEKITTDFVFGFIAGFSSSVMFVLKAYFDRGDKKQDKQGDGNETKVIGNTGTVNTTDTSKG